MATVEGKKIYKVPFWQKKNFLGIALALFATAVWSGNFIIGRGLSDVIPPISLAFFRWLVAFICILPLAAKGLRKEYPLILQHKLFFIFVSAVGIFYFNTALYWGAKTTPALTMSFIAMSAPLFTLLLARIVYKEHLSFLQICGVSVVLFGVASLLAKGDYAAIFRLSFGKGELLVLSASIAFAVYTVLVRETPKGISSLSFLGVTFGLGLAMLTPCFFWEQTAMPGVISFTPSLLLIFIYLGLGTSVIAFFAWSKAIQYIGPGKTSLIYYSLPLFCGVEAMLFLHEPITLVHLASGGCVIGGLLLATRRT